MADTSQATVIFLHSHPIWVAAQRRARERNDAIRRHPSSHTRQRAAAAGSSITPLIRNFKVYSSTDTPA